MARVKIKAENSKDLRKKLKLLELLSQNEIYANKIIVVPDGFIVLTNDESDLDRLFNGTTDRLLIDNDFTPIIPQELKCRRTIVIFNVDTHIYSQEIEDMIQEIMNKNSFTQEQVCDIIKIPRTKIVKVTFTKTNIAKKATETGLKMFSMSISPHQIQQDTHVNIKTCMKCYKIEDHHTSECKKPEDYKICSECGELGHIWRECSNTKKKCINCDQEHRSLAMKCPIRKEITNIKRKENQQNQQSTTYSNITKRNMSQQQTQQMHVHASNAPSPNSTHSNIFQCMLHAHFVNASKPGTYSIEVNTMFKANNHPPLVIPEDPPSLDIIIKMNEEISRRSNIVSQAQSMETETTESVEETRANKTQTEKANTTQTEKATRTNTKKQAETTDTEVMQETILTQGKRKYAVNGEDIGLVLYTKQSEGWPPKDEFTRHVLLKGIAEKKYKFTFTKNTHSEEDILHMIENKTMDIPPPCFSRIDNSTFGKIRQGLMEERTPPPSKEQRRGRKNSC